jgi:AcrR family transcriptional regulator
MGGQSPILVDWKERMPRFKEEERARVKGETRTALLEAAALEFAREGYNGANINRISTAAGYAKGTIYNYFESKRALMQALIEDTAAMHLAYLNERVLQAEMADRRLEVFFIAGFEFVSAHLARGRAIVNNLYGPDVGFKDAMYQAYLPIFELVGHDILALGLEQEIFTRMDPTTMSTLVMLIYLGVAAQISPEGRPWLDAHLVAGFAVRGLRIQPEERQPA